MADAQTHRAARDDKTPAGNGAPTVTSKWRRYLADLQAATAEPLPLETQGRLVRVTGLVLEAAGIRVPVGSVCEIHQDGRGADASPPVIAEVVGFSGDCAYLMPTSEVHIDSRWSSSTNQMNQPVRHGPSASARGLLRMVLPNQR